MRVEHSCMPRGRASGPLVSRGPSLTPHPSHPGLWYPSHSRRGSPAAATASCQATKSSLLKLASQTSRGLDVNRKQLEDVLACVQQLQEEQQQQRAAAPPTDLTATWRLLWTTEKETLFILRNARLFNMTAGDVFQVIDVTKNRLQNVITFQPEGGFVVDSELRVVDPRRCSFKFSSATLKLPGGRNLGLPPFGQGWFDTVFMDEEIRVAQDIRGDTLVVARDGPPRYF